MIIAITQARMSSSRLSGKVLMPILGYPMVWQQLLRTRCAKKIDNSIIATSTDPTDDVLATFLQQMDHSVYRGSLNNVLSRYYHCAKMFGAQHVVRLTADCPLIDPAVIDAVITTHLKDDNDYTSTLHYPLGMSVEVFKFDVLETAYFEASIRAQREHVTLFIYQHPERFKLGEVIFKDDLTNLRLTVDYPEDFQCISRIYEQLHPNNHQFALEDILKLLNEKPELRRINAHCIQNNAMLEAMKKDDLMTYLDN